MNSISVGMTKGDVIDTMGDPVSTSAQGGIEYLNYQLYETSDDAMYGNTKPYYVRLVNGRVDSYGRLGDFDSTKDPTVKIKTEQDITVNQR